MLPVPFHRARTPADALGRKRALYWRNGPRNDFLAAVARAVVAGRRTTPPRPVYPESWPMPRKPAVAVVVESPEHGRELLRRLPGWRLRAAAGCTYPEAAESGNGVGIVATESYLAESGASAHVLVRATGTGGPLDLRGLTAPTGEGLRVLDFEDDFDDVADGWARQRVEHYTRADALEYHPRG
jgi:hypothetical protein